DARRSEKSRLIGADRRRRPRGRGCPAAERALGRVARQTCEHRRAVRSLLDRIVLRRGAGGPETTCKNGAETERAHLIASPKNRDRRSAPAGGGPEGGPSGTDESPTPT